MYCLPRNTHTHPRVDTGHTGSCRSPRTSIAHLIQNCNQQISARLKGLCWPAKQAYFAVRSIWTFDWLRVGASQKLIPRERSTRENSWGGEGERSFFLSLPAPPRLPAPPPCTFGSRSAGKGCVSVMAVCFIFSNCQLCVRLRYGT